MASFRMRLNMSPLPFCAAIGSESSERISDRAITRRFSIFYLREIGWVGLPAPEIIDYIHNNRRMSSMSAGIKLTQSDNSENSSLPNSRRVYVDGQLPGVLVPFREITQSPSRNFDDTLVANPPVRVYDTSGPWGDPSQQCDVREGLPQLRREWIIGRDDVEEYEGREARPIDDGYLTFDAAKRARVKDVGRLEDFPALRRTVLRAKPGACVTQLHYARRGIITPEMEFIAIRENLGREQAQAHSPSQSNGQNGHASRPLRAL